MNFYTSKAKDRPRVIRCASGAGYGKTYPDGERGAAVESTRPGALL